MDLRSTPAQADRSNPTLIGFFALAFAWSWVCWLTSNRMTGTGAEILGIAGRFGPSLAAIVIVALHGTVPVKQFLRNRLGRDSKAFHWAVALLGPPAAVLSGLAIASLLGEQLGDFNDITTLYLVVPAFFQVLVLGGPLAEEVGWRGYALDPLQARLGPILASAALGVTWGLWHLPLFFDPEQIQHDLAPIIYLGQTTATAFVYTWLWNHTRSLPLVMALHASTNVSAGAFPLLVPEAHSQIPFAITVALTVIIVGGLTLATHGKLGWTGRLAPADERTREPSSLSGDHQLSRRDKP